MSNIEKIPLNIENVVFFEQTSFRKFQKEQKTIQDDLQHEITDSTIKPHLVRSQKIKRQIAVSVLTPEVKLSEDVVKHPSSLLSANTIKGFTSSHPNDNAQKRYFERQKITAHNLLDEIIGMILHCKIVGIQFPQGLENILNYGWKDFIQGVTYTKRVWPTAACKYVCLQRRISQRSAHSRMSFESVLTDSGRSRSKAPTPIGEVTTRSAKDEKGLTGTTPVKSKKKTKRKQRNVASSRAARPIGFTINFSISSKASMEQGWIIESYDETLAKLDWKTIYTLMFEKVRAANSKIKMQRKNMAKYGFDKPVILLHYEEARTVPLGKYRKQAPVPVFVLNDGKPQIPALKVENPALNKLHYALNDGSCIIYYPSGNIAVCRSHSGLSCPGAFYTNVFNDSAVQPTLLASFTPFGHGSIFLSGEKSKVLLYHEEGGLLIDENEITLKQWKWPKRGKLAEPIWMQVNDFITVRINGQFSISLTYKWKYEFIRFPLSPLPDVIPPQPDEMLNKNRSSLQRSVEFVGGLPSVSDITIYSLRQIHRRIKNIVDNWMEYYRKETGLSKFGQMVAESDLQLQKTLLSVDLMNFTAVSKDNFPGSADYIHFLSSPGIDKIKCLPRSCTFTSNWSAPISTDNFAVMLAGKRGSFDRTSIKHKLQFPKVHKEDKPWLHSPGPCPVALRSAMMGEGMKHCRCNAVKVPCITDLEYDTFIKRATPGTQQIILVCVMASNLKPMPYENMIQELYKQQNRNRSQPCVQSRVDSFRMLKYDISTANDYTGQSSALLVERHNVTPGMFLMYIGGKLLFADHIFNGYSNTVKDLKKQIAKTYEDYLMGRHLLHDFRFSPFNAELSHVEPDDGFWISQPDHRARPKSETSIPPGTCIIQTSDRAATIQDFIAFSLSQGSGCCSGSVH